MMLWLESFQMMYEIQPAQKRSDSDTSLTSINATGASGKNASAKSGGVKITHKGS
jgi:hypothetical protein